MKKTTLFLCLFIIESVKSRLPFDRREKRCYDEAEKRRKGERQVRRFTLWLRRYAGVLLLFGGALVVRTLAYVSPQSAVVTSACMVLGHLLTIALFFLWMLSMRARMTQKTIYRYLRASTLLMLSLLFARILRYDYLAGAPELLRPLWYFYYLAVLVVPLLNFFSALCVGREEDYRVSKTLRLLYLPALLLFLCVMTNDRHRLVFTIAGDAPGAEVYGYGPLYYVVAGWALVFMALFLGVLVRRCRLPNSRRRVWAPLVVILLGVAQLLVNILLQDTALKAAGGFIDVVLTLCVCDAAVWEACISSGLLVSNNRFGELFAKSTLRAQIVSDDGRVRYAAEDAPPLTEAQIRQAKTAPVMLDENTRLNAAPIGGGFVLWAEDLTDVHRMLRRIEGAVARLDESNRALSRENEIRRQIVVVREQNRLYGSLAESVSEKLQEVETLLDSIDRGDTAPQAFSLVCVQGAYIKRKLNLLLAETDGRLPSHEWDQAVKESLYYASLCGLTARLETFAPCQLSASVLLDAYDRFEAALEEKLPDGGCWVVAAARTDDRVTAAFLPDYDEKAGDAPDG